MKTLWQWTGITLFWLSWPLLWLYFRPSHRTRVLIVAGDDILLVKGWLASGKWGLPGGGIHKGEEPQIGACREVAEETGLKLEPASLQVIFFNRKVREGGLTFHVDCFMTRIPNQSTARPRRPELVEVRWAKASDLPHDTSVSPLTRQLVRAWLDSVNLLH